MKLLQPIHRIGDQKGTHLGLGVIEYAGAPFFMLALAGIGIFIAGAAVKPVQPGGVSGKMSRHPVEDHPDARLMTGIHKEHEILRGAVAGGGGEVSGDLIPPGAVKGMLHHRQQLNVGIAHVLHIGDQLLRQLAVGKGVAVRISPPGAGVHLINVHRTVVYRGVLFFMQPFFVPPAVTADFQHFGCRAGAGLLMNAAGVTFIHGFPVSAHDVVFIAGVRFHMLESAGEYAALQTVHGLSRRIPVIKIADQRHRAGSGSPYPEGIAVVSGIVTPQPAVAMAVRPLGKPAYLLLQRLAGQCEIHPDRPPVCFQPSTMPRERMPPISISIVPITFEKGKGFV